MIGMFCPLLHFAVSLWNNLDARTNTIYESFRDTLMSITNDKLLLHYRLKAGANNYGKN